MSTSAIGTMIPPPPVLKKRVFRNNHIGFVKSLTSKPVVGVGRYTSPESMVSAIKRGVVDLIGAARPSIADPFLPKKIQEGRFEDIRECIGCNICVTGDTRWCPSAAPKTRLWARRGGEAGIRKSSRQRKALKEILVVGGGPAGLECARALGQRGYDVVLTEARRD